MAIGHVPRVTLVVMAATCAAVFCVSAGSSAFSSAPSLRQRQQLTQPLGGRQALSPVPLVAPEHAAGVFVSGAGGPGVIGAALKGLALALVGGVALCARNQRGIGPKGNSLGNRRIWRKLVRSDMQGRRRVKRDQRPGVLSTLKDPLDKCKIYRKHCNKIYKVIREATATVDSAPGEVLSDLDPQKAVVRPLNEAAEKFVNPALWNQPAFRALALVLGGALAGRVMPFAAMLHLSAYGIWLGTNVWTTFIAGITMFKNLPRQQFGSLQSKLFPKYFQLGTVCTTLMLLTGYRLGLPLAPAAASLACTLTNLLYLEPKATGVMFERYERTNQGLKDSAIDKELKGKFGKLHGMSSLANLLALVGLVSHGTLVAARLGGL